MINLIYQRNTESNISSFNERHLFELLPLQNNELPFDEKSYKANDVSKHRILIMKKGKGELIIDSVKMQLSDNMVYCLSPGQIYHIKAEENPEGVVIAFASSFPGLENSIAETIFNRRLFTNIGSGTIIKIDEEINDELSFALTYLSREYLSGTTLKMEVIRQYLKIILIILSKKVQPQKPKEYNSTKSQIVSRFFILVQKNFITKKQVTEYASLLAVSPNYLNNLVKRVSGFPASYHIQQSIIREAKRQAVYSDCNMKEIAFALGFEEITHFCKFFKKMEGVTFSQYRKKTYKELVN